MDETKLGFVFPSFSMTIERGKIREFARATLDDRLLYRDEAVAAEEGFTDIPAPPTFCSTEVFWSDVARARVLGFDITRMLKGGTEWEYLKPIVVGDTLTLSERVSDISTKKGRSGTMTIVTTETEYTNQHGEIALRVTNTMIELDRMPA